MKNVPLLALWLIAGVGVAVGAVMIFSGQGGPGLFDDADYATIYLGVGVLGLGVLAAVGGLTASAIGYYLEAAREPAVK